MLADSVVPNPVVSLSIDSQNLPRALAILGLGPDTVLNFVQPTPDLIENSSSDFKNYCHEALQAETIVDVYPLNGVYPSKGKQLEKKTVRDTVATALQKNIEFLQAKHAPEMATGVKLFVLDIKDHSLHYDDKTQILEAENKIIALFRSELKAKANDKETGKAKAHRLVREASIHYLLKEGQLKADLMSEVFDANQGHFFQETPAGRQLLCQICEIIMNGFKIGMSVTCGGHIFHPEKYFADISENFLQITDVPAAEIKPSKLGRGTLLTAYSANYREAYGREGSYFRAYSSNPAFASNMQHKHDPESGTTTIALKFGK